MFVLGVTGGIGSGKSAATEIFSSLGIKIVDADVLSRVPVQKGESGLLEIEKDTVKKFFFLPAIWIEKN